MSSRTGGAVRGAQRPPAGLDGWDERWSRLVVAPDAAGVERTWHVLDTGPDGSGRGAREDGATDSGATDSGATDEVVGTLLCVHGNPTWAYAWRALAAACVAAPGRRWRVVAPDQLEMGFSERTGTVRTLATRIADLHGLVAALGLSGDVVAVGQDWGGIVVSGWAGQVRAAAQERTATGGGAPGGRHLLRPELRLAGLVVGNTAASYPAQAPAPGALKLVTLPGVLPLVTSTGDAFLRVTLGLPRPALSAAVKAGFRAPYRRAADRTGVEAFVADVPLGPDHVSRPALDAVTAGVEALDAAGLPALVLWGPRDPVFSEWFLRDWRARMPGADVHRFAGASHLVAEDPQFAATVLRWLDERVAGAPQDPAAAPVASPRAPRLFAALEQRSAQDSPAVVEVRPDGSSRSVSWALLNRRTTELAAGLCALGVVPGQRVSLLVPPGADLTAALYAVLRVGAVAVVADAGLGVRGLTRAVTGSGVDWVVGVGRALAAARALRWPGRRIAAGDVPDAVLRAVGAELTLLELAELGAARLATGAVLPAEPAGDAPAAVLFTSGSTGPAKGVVYTHAQLAQLAAAMGATIRTGPDAPLVSAFAPFALFGPALGATCVVPAMDVTRPRTLTAAALADAVAASGATSAFLAPAAVVNVLATAPALTGAQRAALARVTTVLSAGAPVPLPLLQRLRDLVPAADPRTPYGATEVLPATDVGLSDLLEAGAGEGICVGRPVPGVVLGVSPLDADGRAGDDVVATTGVTGEVVVGGEHVKDHYDQLWATQSRSVRVRPTPELTAAVGAGRWHRTGDVGHLDDAGRLWIEGRLAHVVVTADAVLTPVGPEQRAETVEGVARAAFVGVGPRGARQLVVVAEAEAPVGRTTVADPGLAQAVRAATGVNLAAVLLVPALPTDVRHNSKIDRVATAAWAERVLAGDRAGRLA